MNHAAIAERSLEDVMADSADRTTEVFTEDRPWGAFQSFVTNEKVTVKVITVAPHSRLSLQTHTHRAEMWQVLDGPLDVTVDENTWQAHRGDLIWVPQGATHRLGNSSAVPGRVLEVGFGHFDEQDIIRLEDDYVR